MIYKKDANFPYPLLTNTSSSYRDSRFILDVDLQDNISNYRFDLTYNIDSLFILNLLESGKAELILVIQSKDNKFFKIKSDDEFVDIPKSRISLGKRTIIQLLIQSKGEISFQGNNDLSSFYEEFKDSIIVPRNSILGFSNYVTFEGSNIKPLDLFEKKLDPNIKSDIQIELGNETIVIIYKNESLQFVDSPMSPALNNPYVYMGLQKALYRFIINNAEDMEQVNLDDIDPPTNNLDFKLYNLMKRKMVSELTLENIDEVIYLISDKILEKYTTRVRGLYSNGN